MQSRSWAGQQSVYHELTVAYYDNIFTYTTLHMPRDDNLSWCDTQGSRDFFDFRDVECLFD